MKLGNANNNNSKGILLEAYFQGVKRLFGLAFHDTENGDKKFKQKSHQK